MTEFEDASAENAEPQKRHRHWLDDKAVVLGAVVALQIVAAVALTRFVIAPRLAVHNADAAASTAALAIPDLGVIVGLDEIIVTLQSDSRLPRYLKIDVNLEVADEVTAELAETRRPQLRDIVIMAASARSPADIQTPEGKQRLREEIFDRLREKLPAERLRNVFFSDLVIQ